MRYVIKRSCTNKKAKYPQEYTMEELKILAKKLKIKGWTNMKKGELCKKISKPMKRHFDLNFKKKKRTYKPIIKQKNSIGKKSKKKIKKVKFESNNFIKYVDYVPNKYHNTDYQKYKVDRDPIKEYCSQTVFPKFSYFGDSNKSKHRELLTKNNLNKFRNNIKEGRLEKDFSEDDLAELEICEEYLE